MLLIIDRIEADIAVCELPDRTMQHIPLSALPGGVREGDCLRPQGDGYRVDAEETERRRQQNAERLRRLLNKKK